MAVLDPRFEPNHVSKVVNKLSRTFNSEVKPDISLEQITPENRGLVEELQPGGFLFRLLHMRRGGGQSERK